jgi:hypothetical protein
LGVRDFLRKLVYPQEVISLAEEVNRHVNLIFKVSLCPQLQRANISDYLSSASPHSLFIVEAGFLVETLPDTVKANGE